MTDRYNLVPIRVPFPALAKIYGVSPQALKKAGVKLQLRPDFLTNPEAVRAAMIADGYSRGKLRKIVFDESECRRIDAEVDRIRFPEAYAPEVK